MRLVLEGSVRKTSDAVRIAVQLVDATTGANLWAERFDRPVPTKNSESYEKSRDLGSIRRSVAGTLKVVNVPSSLVLPADSCVWRITDFRHKSAIRHTQVRSNGE